LIFLSDELGTSVDHLKNMANKRLEEEVGKDSNSSFVSVSLWLVTPTLQKDIEVRSEIKDVSQIKPNCKVEILVELKLVHPTYVIAMNVVVNESGALELKNSNVEDIRYPYLDDGDLWEKSKEIAVKHGVTLASLTVQTLNASITILRLMGILK